MTLFTFSVVVGQGARLFPATGREVALELVESQATPCGIRIHAYRLAGAPGYAAATPTRPE